LNSGSCRMSMPRLGTRRGALNFLSLLKSKVWSSAARTRHVAEYERRGPEAAVSERWAVSLADNIGVGSGLGGCKEGPVSGVKRGRMAVGFYKKQKN
jgi:hypothetical protein